MAKPKATTAGGFGSFGAGSKPKVKPKATAAGGLSVSGGAPKPVLDSSYQLVFDPSGLVNFSRSAFGLGPIAITEIDRQGVTIPVKPLFEAPSSPVPIWRYAAVALIALSLGGYGATQKYNQQVALFNLDSQQNVTKQVAKQIQEATLQINSALPIVELVIPKPHQPYHVVAGAFRVAQNAHNKVAQLMIKGFDAKIVGINSYGLHQVVYRSFTDRNEAINALRRIQKEESSDAWLLVK